jgi:hypothetical protein
MGLKIYIGLNWTEPQSSLFPVAAAHIWDQLQLPVAMFRKYLKIEKDRFFVPSHVGPYSRTILLNFQSLNHQKRSRID